MMARSPIQVRGVQKLVGALTNAVVKSAREGVKMMAKDGSDVELTARGQMSVEGRYGFDSAGKFGIQGRVIADFPGDIPVGLDGGVESGKWWENDGDGDVKLSLNVEIKVTPEL